jgi:hypothetical protein
VVIVVEIVLRRTNPTGTLRSWQSVRVRWPQTTYPWP